MALRYFCDLCSDEVQYPRRHLTRALGDFRVEAVAHAGPKRGGDPPCLCEACIVRIVTEGRQP